MMKNTILLLLIFSLFACTDDDANFVTSREGLEIKFTPVAGGAMMYYTLPNNRDIFAMNIRYPNLQGEEVLKSCGYSGDSLLLDGFSRTQEVYAQISLVNHRGEESESFEYQFSTLESAPWAFFNDLEIHPSWNGFQVIYKSPSVVTGMAHVFYMGINPTTQQEDTILVKSFPILRGGDTLNFITEQKDRLKNTVVIRTEDFQGYRVREGIFPDIDAFSVEQWPMTPENFIKGPSREDAATKVGKQYLFDGELKGAERLIASAYQNLIDHPYTSVYGAYMAGPNAFEKPIVLDLREQKIPAWIRLYCLFPLRKATHPASPYPTGEIWIGSYEDKVPCHLTVYGSKESSNPDTGEWVYLGNLNQDPMATGKDRWSAATTMSYLAPKDLADLATKDPIYVDVVFPAIDNSYRYLKIIVHDTFRVSNSEINKNPKEYFTLQELEVYVKKN